MRILHGQDSVETGIGVQWRKCFGQHGEGFIRQRTAAVKAAKIFLGFSQLCAFGLGKRFICLCDGIRSGLFTFSISDRSFCGFQEGLAGVCAMTADEFCIPVNELNNHGLLAVFNRLEHLFHGLFSRRLGDKHDHGRIGILLQQTDARAAS